MGAPLATILAHYPALARPTAPPTALGNAGGASGARLWRFPSGLGPLVLRAWPPDGPNRDELAAIHAQQRKARGLGFVPVPIETGAGGTVVEWGGRRWDLAPWMPGAADAARPPALARLRAGCAGLAALHETWGSRPSEGPSPGLALRLEEIAALRNGGFDAIEAALDRAPADPRRDHARRWLDLARLLAHDEWERLRRVAPRTVTRQPCLRDARPEHFLFVGDRLTGLIDFGATGIDSVSGDLARLLGEWVGAEPHVRDVAIAAYAAIRPLDAEEVALIAAFERPTAFLIGAHWTRWHFLEGRTFDDSAAVLSGLKRGWERLSGLVGPGGDKAGIATPRAGNENPASGRERPRH